jgi:hypothetical protein
LQFQSGNGTSKQSRRAAAPQFLLALDWIGLRRSMVRSTTSRRLQIRMTPGRPRSRSRAHAMARFLVAKSG